MEGLAIFMVFGIFIIMVIMAIANTSLDDDRIAKEIEKKGGRLLTNTRSFFGPGWTGEQNDRIYKVTYIDKDGHTNEAFIKTNNYGSVYFAQNQIIKRAEHSKNGAHLSKEQLVEENTRLKEEVQALKMQLGQLAS